MYMLWRLHVQGQVWALVSVTQSCSSLPLCLRAGTTKCYSPAFKLPWNLPALVVKIRWLQSWERRSHVKGVETRNAQL